MTTRTFVLTATNASGSAQASATVNVADAPPSGLPAWLQGKAVGEWVAIPGTAMTSYDLSVINAAGLNPGGWEYGNPKQGIFAYSGGCVKGGNTLLLFGGGGAGAWAGNEVRALDLSQDAPAWSTLIPPSPASAVWPRNSASNPWDQSGKPVARHSYWQPQYVDATNEFWLFGCANDWQTDSSNYPDVARYGNGAWDAAGTHPNLPHARSWDGPLTVKHPATEDVFMFMTTWLSKWSHATHQWSDVNSAVPLGMEKAFGAIHPGIGTAGKLLRVSAALGGHTCYTFDCATGAMAAGDLVGPYASVFAPALAGNYFATIGCDYDSGLDCLLVYMCKAQILKLTPSGNNWNVDLLSTTGTPPLNDGSYDGGNGIYGRFRYLPQLKGVVMMYPGPWANPTQKCFFVRTS